MFVGLTLLASPASVSAWTDDYPSAWQGAMDSMLDSWGYYKRECTSFTAWRLHARNGFEMPRAIGNAGGWGNWAAAHGYSVNMNPAVGSVAWFSTHVAWVESVGSGFVTIEDYNGVDSNHNGVYGDDGTYSERNISTNSVRGYIHFRDGSGQGGSGVAGLTLFGSDHLSPNQELAAGQYMLSDDARFFTVMQSDGNFVVYGPGNQPYWSTHTAGSGAVHAVMQSDGNFVLYRSNWMPVWNSHTDGLGTSALYMQSDGNLVVYKTSGPASWASNT
jgi:surface antigen